MEIETAINLQLADAVFPVSPGGMEAYCRYWEGQTRRVSEDEDDESQRLFRTVLLAVKED